MRTFPLELRDCCESSQVYLNSKRSSEPTPAAFFCCRSVAFMLSKGIINSVAELRSLKPILAAK